MPPADAETSVALLQRVQEGDTQALDALVARYRPRLVRWASRRLPAFARDLTETQDLVQDTLLSAFRKIEGLEWRGEGSLQAYLRQALLNRIRMEIRRAHRKPAPDVLDSREEADLPSPLEQAIGNQALSAYEQALARLRPDERELVIARVEFGFGNDELASAFGRPSANAARMSVQRALLKLASFMNEPTR
jgi:RNA polymerase sigma factor (sigma-70 family)